LLLALAFAEKVELIETAAEALSYFPRLAARLKARPDTNGFFHQTVRDCDLHHA
jgi:hypothetical protein